MSNSSIFSAVGYAVGSYFGYPQLGTLFGPSIGGAFDPANVGDEAAESQPVKERIDVLPVRLD